MNTEHILKEELNNFKKQLKEYKEKYTEEDYEILCKKILEILNNTL